MTNYQKNGSSPWLSLPSSPGVTSNLMKIRKIRPALGFAKTGGEAGDRAGATPFQARSRVRNALSGCALPGVLRDRPRPVPGFQICFPSDFQLCFSGGLFMAAQPNSFDQTCSADPQL
jgi:hypothetical protein